MFQPKKKHYTTVHGFLVFLSFTIGIILISNLEWEDRITITRGLGLFVTGLIFFTTLYNFLNGIAVRTSIGQRLTKKYKLSVADVYEINNK